MSLSSRSVWSIVRVPGWPGLHRETASRGGGGGGRLAKSSSLPANNTVGESFYKCVSNTLASESLWIL